MKITIECDIKGRHMLMLWAFGLHFRAWLRPWTRPYAGRFLGNLVFGAGPFGCMIFW